jgi:hypothetical protein
MVAGGERKVSAWRISRLLISTLPFDNVNAVSFQLWGVTLEGEQSDNHVLGLGLFQHARILNAC